VTAWSEAETKKGRTERVVLRLLLDHERNAGLPTTGRFDTAIEVESLGQAAVVELVHSALDALLPDPLADVLEREQAQRAEARARLRVK
jgi:hypothetical protein